MLTTFRIGLPGVPRPGARADPVGERRHPVEHLVDVGDDVAAVDDERRPSRHPEGDVEHRAVLGRVDPVAAEHRLRALCQARLAGELEQEPQRLVGDPVLGVVEVDARRPRPRAARRAPGRRRTGRGGGGPGPRRSGARARPTPAVRGAARSSRQDVRPGRLEQREGRRDRRPGRSRAPALEERDAADADSGHQLAAGHGSHGSLQPPWSRVRASAASGPQVPGSYVSTGGGASISGCTTRHISSTTS